MPGGVNIVYLGVSASKKTEQSTMLLYKYFKCVQYAATIVNISEASPIVSIMDLILLGLVHLCQDFVYV